MYLVSWEWEWPEGQWQPCRSWTRRVRALAALKHRMRKKREKDYTVMVVCCYCLEIYVERERKVENVEKPMRKM